MLDQILPVYRFSSQNVDEEEIPRALDQAWNSLTDDDKNFRDFAIILNINFNNVSSIKQCPFDFEVETSGSIAAECVYLIFIAATYKFLLKPISDVGEKKMAKLFEKAFDEHLLPRFKRALGKNNHIEKK